jgi:hypothetical protein
MLLRFMKRRRKVLRGGIPTMPDDGKRLTPELLALQIQLACLSLRNWLMLLALLQTRSEPRLDETSFSRKS